MNPANFPADYVNSFKPQYEAFFNAVDLDKISRNKNTLAAKLLGALENYILKSDPVVTEDIKDKVLICFDAVAPLMARGLRENPADVTDTYLQTLVDGVHRGVGIIVFKCISDSELSVARINNALLKLK